MMRHMTSLSHVDWNDIPIIRQYALKSTSNLHGLVMINIIFVPVQLGRGVDGLALPSVSILVQNGNGRSMLSLDNTSSSDNGDINDLVIINTPDIHSPVRFLNNAYIITSNTTICTLINQGSNLARLVSRHRVMDLMIIDLAIFLAIDNNLISFWWGWCLAA